jgi:LL-diaminopimelate aminotransferase
MQEAQRIKDIPPYLFAEVDRKIAEKKTAGRRVISFGIGDPDMPTPSHIVEALCRAAAEPENHRYPSYQGMPEFRQTAAAWVGERFGVALDPDDEVLCLIGSKDGISHFPLAFLDPGDVALVPDPAYPVYAIASTFAGGEPYFMPLREEEGWLPDLEAIPAAVLERSRIMFLNYPNNPTTATAPLSFYQRVVELAHRHDLIIAHDLAYSEITYDGYVAPSILQVDGAREVSIEFHSLSKTYNMTGWRVGFAAGAREIIGPFGKLKTNIDSGVFNAVQAAAVEALRGPQDCVEKMRAVYASRRERLLACFSRVGWEVCSSLATIYLWMKVPAGYSSVTFAEDLLERTDIVVVPGSAYGSCGEGYARLSLSIPDGELDEAIQRIEATYKG